MGKSGQENWMLLVSQCNFFDAKNHCIQTIIFLRKTETIWIIFAHPLVFIKIPNQIQKHYAKHKQTIKKQQKTMKHFQQIRCVCVWKMQNTYKKARQISVYMLESLSFESKDWFVCEISGNNTKPNKIMTFCAKLGNFDFKNG